MNQGFETKGKCYADNNIQALQGEPYYRRDKYNTYARSSNKKSSTSHFKNHEKKIIRSLERKIIERNK